MFLRFSLVLVLFMAACGGDGDDMDAGPVYGHGDLAFMSTCDPADDLCNGSGTPPQYCFPFNAKGPHCTHECASAADCPAPSPGCSNMGVCKAPDL